MISFEDFIKTVQRDIEENETKETKKVDATSKLNEKKDAPIVESKKEEIKEK